MLWNKSYETGVASIDEQHKELFRQVDLLSDPSKGDRAKATLDFLGGYVVKHFGHEEMLQAKTKYPKAAEHKKMHTDLIATYKQLRSDFDKNPGKEALQVMKITSVLTKWLREHIMQADKDFTEYYQKTV